MNSLNICELAKIPLFTNLSNNALKQINSAMCVKIIKARKSFIHMDVINEAMNGATQVLQVGGWHEHRAEDIFIIYHGTVKICIEPSDISEEIILAMLGKGEVVGELGFINHQGRSATAVAQEETTLLLLRHQAFERFLDDIPALAKNLIQILGRRLRLANEQIQIRSMKGVEHRVARQLAILASECGEPLAGKNIYIPMYMTQGDIACLVDARRQNVNRALQDLKHKKYLSEQRHHIIVHDLAGLISTYEAFSATP